METGDAFLTKARRAVARANAFVSAIAGEEVVDVVLDRMVELNELGLPVYVVPEWPAARIEAHWRETSSPVPIERLLPIG